MPGNKHVGHTDRVGLRVHLLPVERELRLRIVPGHIIVRHRKHAAGSRAGVVERAQRRLGRVGARSIRIDFVRTLTLHLNMEYEFSPQKDELLRRNRGISFIDVIEVLEEANDE